MTGLRLLMVVSGDGFVARGPDDDMSWTGPTDKQAFRLLTGVDGVMGAGRRTYDLMPKNLPGRFLFRLTTSPSAPFGMGLREFHDAHPGAWLIGGQTIALAALTDCLVAEAHICYSPVYLGSGIRDEVSPTLWSMWREQGLGHRAMVTRLVDGTRLDVWRRWPELRI